MTTPSISHDPTPGHQPGRRRRRRRLWAALGLLVIAIAAVAAFFVRQWLDEDEDDIAETPATEATATDDGDVIIIEQVPSLAATVAIDGEEVEGTVAVERDQAAALDVEVTNDGNVTMSGVGVALEVVGVGDPEPVDECDLPVLAPGETAGCSLEFTATADSTSVVATVSGRGPQQQPVEVELVVELD